MTNVHTGAADADLHDTLHSAIVTDMYECLEGVGCGKRDGTDEMRHKNGILSRRYKHQF